MILQLQITERLILAITCYLAITYYTTDPSDLVWLIIHLFSSSGEGHAVVDNDNLQVIGI